MAKKINIEFFENAEEMPIKRFQRFNKYLMIDIEVGSDFEDYDNRTLKAIELLRKKKYDDAIKEIDNRRQMVYQAYEEYSPKHFALALCVKSINGKPCKEIHEKALLQIIEILDKSGYTQKQLINDVNDVKKKFTINWSRIFPKISTAWMRKISTSFL